MKREDMKAAAKFTVTCERCGVKIARNVTHYTAASVAAGHEHSHRLSDRDDQ